MTLNDKIASFSLVRTNPKISGNVKITIDSRSDIWLNSIDANRELSSSIYKKYRISSTTNYDSDLKKFIGKLPPEVVFDVKMESNADAISNTFQTQYDLFYAMGAQPLVSEAYDEDYSYFAPMWLREQLPDYFVIFRIDTPLDHPYNENVDLDGISIVKPTSYKVVGSGFEVAYESRLYADGETFISNASTSYSIIQGTGKVISLDENKDLPLDYTSMFDDLVKNAQIIKTFDLTENSNIGQYIRNIRNNPNLPQAPMSVRFDKGLLTTWNGVAYQDGIYASKGEYLDDLWSHAQTQIDFEEYITKGFERHGVICPFLLNLEFLFSDDTATMYSIPRYFGFYVSKFELGRFQLDGQKLFDLRSISGNTPTPKRANKGFKYQPEDFFQNNEKGVRLYYENPTGFIPNSDLFDSTNFERRMYWIQDRLGNFHSLNQKPDLYVDGAYNLTETDLVVRNTSLNLGNFSGPDAVKLQSKGTLLPDKGRSYLTIKVKDILFPNDKIKIYWNIGTQTDVDGRYDEITANDLRRYFTIAASGTTVSIYGDVSMLYASGDEIEITYNSTVRASKVITSNPIYFGGYTTFSINSALNATAIDGYISIEKGWGPESALAAQSMVPIYFHPYGTNTQIAKAIANAFNKLERRTFDAIAIDDTVVIRMRDGSSIPNQFFSMTNLTLYDRLEIQATVLTGPTQKILFEGGTDKSTTRMRCALDEIEKLGTGDVYARTKLGTSKIVQVGRYVDAAVQEVGGSDIATLDGFDIYGVFVIENPLDQPILGTSQNYVAYSLYEIPTGVFSFFNVKDMDGDFLSSTYGRSPVNEYHRYFDLIPNEAGQLVPGRQYRVLGDVTDTIIYDTTTYAGGSVFTATTPTLFTVSAGTPIVVTKIFYQPAYSADDKLAPGVYNVLGDPINDIIEFPPYTSNFYNASSSFTVTTSDQFRVSAGNPTVVKNALEDIDPDLKSFPGFNKFKDFLTIEDEIIDKNTIIFSNRDKFFFNDLISEYDYLKENFTKELSTKSRLSQYITKWVYSGGSDVRDNPYRLNVHPIFNTLNFSPSFNLKVQNPDGFTHEWYYLEGAPQQYSIDFTKDNYYFFNDTLDYNSLIDCDPASLDYFQNYFTFQPTSDSAMQERYSIFSYNKEVGLCEAFFRGIKIRIKEIIRETATSELKTTKPPFKDRSTLFDEYKFTVLLRTSKERKSLLESPVTIQIIENSTFKTITMLVDIIIEDYRTLQITDPSQLGYTASPELIYPDNLNSTVDYLLLYSLKNKRSESTYTDSANFFEVGTDSNKIGDIKLSVALDFSSPAGAVGQYTYVNVFDNPNYDWDLRDEVKNFKSVNYMYGEFQFGETSYPNALSSTQRQILFGIPGITPEYTFTDSSSIPVDTPQPFANLISPNNVSKFVAPTVPPTQISIPFGSVFEWDTFVTSVHEGGKLYYEPIMQRISFGKLAQKINEYSPYIKYKSFEFDGTNTVEITPRFYLELVEPSLISKNESLIPQTDDDKPEEFKNEPAIGVNNVLVNSAQPMYRYGGPFEPKFRDIFFYDNQITDTLQPANISLAFQQATFNPTVAGFGLINNFWYQKVADKDILSLVNNTKYKSVYPLIHEIAIDKMNFPVYQSNWDPGFFRKFVNKSTFQYQAGTREMLEDKNFLATKIMKTPRTLTLETFSTEQISSPDEVNVDSFTGELLFYVQPSSRRAVSAAATVETKVIGFINVQKRLIRFLTEDGANTEFNKYLMPEFGIGDPDSLSDDVVDYLTLNVLPTYKVDKFVPYVRYYREDSLALPIVRGDLSDVQKFENDYKIENNFTSVKVSNFVYRFEFTVEPGKNASIAISLDIDKI